MNPPLSSNSFFFDMWETIIYSSLAATGGAEGSSSSTLGFFLNAPCMRAAICIAAGFGSGFLLPGPRASPSPASSLAGPEAGAEAARGLGGATPISVPINFERPGCSPPLAKARWFFVLPRLILLGCFVLQKGQSGCPKMALPAAHGESSEGEGDGVRSQFVSYHRRRTSFGSDPLDADCNLGLD